MTCVDDEIQCVNGRGLEVAVTGNGTPKADGTADGSDAVLAMDGSPATCWRARPGQDVPTWEWLGHRRECFTEVFFVPASGDGEETPLVNAMAEVLDADGRVRATGPLAFDGKVISATLRDPVSNLRGVWGSRVRVTFARAAADECGIAELYILAARPR